MANVVQSLIGPVATNLSEVGGPVGTALPNATSNNTQATLRRSYRVQLDAATTSLLFDTNLPTQAAPGSYAIAMTPVAGQAQMFYTRGVEVTYNATNGVVALMALADVNDTEFVLSIDLAHSVTR